MDSIPTLALRPRGEIPQLGFGTWQMSGDVCRRAVEEALACGYRHVDTADIYGNHGPVGAALEASGVPRDEYFLTTKVWRDHLDYDGVLASCDRLLTELRVDYLNLLLIHWPNNDIPMDQTFRAMSRLIDDGLIRACGVSNFTASRLDRALALDLAPIAVDQVEYHPLLNQKELHRYCREKGVVLTAYSPLAQGKVAEDPTLQDVARKYGKTPAQVTLRWLLQRGLVAIPKAASLEHIRSNFHIFDFELTPEDFQAIDTIDSWNRLLTWEVGEFDE